MTTKELAAEICKDIVEMIDKGLGNSFNIEEMVYLRLLCFLATDYQEGYGAEKNISEIVFAKTHAYFWLPCIVCGTWHSGRQWRGAGSPAIIINRNTGHGVCGNCAKEAKRLSLKYPNGIREEVPE